MAKLKGKIKASTLLEVIVAMVVILIVFVLATGIYANVMRSSPSVKQQRVKAILSGWIAESIAAGNWKDEVIAIDSMAFQKTVTPYQTYPDLRLVKVVAIEQGKEIGVLKRVVKVGKDEPE
ncbi:hypothetical protein FBD94_15445 [Pedobacter hiemivivus]|uniref:Type II secretion system protein n=1 Tax=Pedobacter hiemivivus TaxID=2530454 RepID=A0A4U1G9F5_9SPHI|nr:hypothetical protein [Pedobacter hiemivivus]TKC60298.1 hypothetical protein FBD94_15445 [Pedobacter hiemivivus]